MFKKNKKLVSFIGVISMVFLQVFPIGVRAATVTSLIDPTTGAINLDDVTGLVGSSESKKQGPQVEISFAPADNYKEGTKVTATAAEGGFMDEEEDHYYTWYLKREGCGLTDEWWKGNKNVTEKEDKIRSCDLDGDELITPNDWKIAAVRANIKGDFDKNTVDYSSASLTGGNSAGGFEAEPSVTDDNKGWIKNFKRDGNGDLKEENSEDAPNCYMQQPSSGTIYELRKTEASFDECPSGYVPSCVEDTTASCDVLNPEWTQTNVDNANAQIITINNHFTAAETVPASDYVYSGSLFDQEQIEELITDNNANVGEAGYPKLLNYDDHVLPQKTISNDFNACAVVSEEGKNAEDIFKCAVENEEDAKDYKATLSCGGNKLPLCTQEGVNMPARKSSDSNLLGTIFQRLGTNSENETNSICSVLASPNNGADILAPPPNFLDNTHAPTDTVNESCSYLSNLLVNGLKEDFVISGFTVPSGTTQIEANTDLLPTCTFEKGANLCKHLFPYFPEKKVTVKSSTIDLSDEIAGDGKFTLKEKEFWGADPGTAKTNGEKLDEAVVVGAGVSDFTWTYASGDKVGVVVEGTAELASSHVDSSYMTMWAFSKGECSAMEETDQEDIDEGKRAFYKEDSVGILTAEFDLDRCLEENLVDPKDAEDEGIYDMKIELSATPNSPINDESGNGDTLKVVAGVQNVEDLSSVYYKWSIELSEDGSSTPNDDTVWTDITTDMIDEYSSLKNADREGLGKNELKVLLNLPAEVVDPDSEGVFYLKIRAKSTENSGGENQTAGGSITIKVRQQEKKIEAYSVIATSDGKLSLDTANGVFCNTSTEERICYVAENKIIGIMIPNDDGDLSGFSWKVNSVSMSCTSSMSSDCTDGSVLIFPALGNKGEVINVIGTALSKKTGGTVEVNRYFVIAEPSITIVSTNTNSAWPKLMGYFKDLDNNNTADYSSRIIETNQGNIVTLQAETSAVWAYFGETYEWTIDGATVDSVDSTISFEADKESGNSFDVTLVMNNLYTEENVTKINYLRKALYNNWGVDSDDYSSDSIGASIAVNVVENSYTTVNDSGKKGIFASLITNLPQQLMFLLRVSSTVLVLIISMGMIFTFIPESIFERKVGGASYQ